MNQINENTCQCLNDCNYQARVNQDDQAQQINVVVNNNDINRNCPGCNPCNCAENCNCRIVEDVNRRISPSKVETKVFIRSKHN